MGTNHPVRPVLDGRKRKDLLAHVDETVDVVGQVVELYVVTIAQKKHFCLALDDLRAQPFRVVVPMDAVQTAKESGLDPLVYKSRWIKVCGNLEQTTRGNLQIRLNDLDQVMLLEGEAQAAQALHEQGSDTGTPGRGELSEDDAPAISGTVAASRYILLQRLDKGGFSEVYRAVDTQNGSASVAVKLLPGSFPPGVAEEFFYRETESLSRMDHPRIVKILDSGYDDTRHQYYIVLEYVPGETLESRYARKRIPVKRALGVMLQIADGVAYAHYKEVLHRDLKPSNIMVDSLDNVRILDFGIARVVSELHAGVTVRGYASQGYSSPEQREGRDVDERTDIYSFGAVFFRLLTGWPPTAQNLPMIDAIDGITEETRSVVKKMLATNRDERFRSMVQVRNVLLRLQQEYENRTNCYYLQLTQQAIDTLHRVGRISTPSDEAAAEWLAKDLKEGAAIHQTENDQYEIVGRESQLLCDIHRIQPGMLAIIQIRFPPSRILDRIRESSVELPGQWIVCHRGEVHQGNLNELISKLNEHHQVMEVQRQRDIEHKTVFAKWERLLSFQRRQVFKIPPLKYRRFSVSPDRSYLEVELTDEVPGLDDLLGQPLLITMSRDLRPQPIGVAAHVEGKTLTVSLARDVDPDDIATVGGEICVDNRQVAASLRRQETALAAIKYGECVNRGLADVIKNPSLAKVGVIPDDLQFINCDLDDYKKKAVASALGCNSMFLIQGPPGTGKTTVISEIIAQIIRQNPKAKVLLVSQSNVAADHALQETKRIAPWIAAVRFGRDEKIDEGSRAYDLDSAVAEFARNTIARSEAYATETKAKTEADVANHAVFSEMVMELKQNLLKLRAAERELAKAKYQVLYGASDPDQCETDTTQSEAEVEDLVSVLLGEINAGMELLCDSLELDRVAVQTADELSDHLKRLDHALSQRAKHFGIVDKTEVLRQEWVRRIGKSRDFQTVCIKMANLIVSTCVGCPRIPGIDSIEFDWIVIDEAGRATPPELFVPMSRGKRVILVGDHRQLPPVFEADLSADDLRDLDLSITDVEKGLFEQLVEQVPDETRILLRRQYRMHPGISELISNVFYEGNLVDGVSADKLRTCLRWSPRSVVWISTSQRKDRFEQVVGSSRSKRNFCEVRIIASILREIEAAYTRNGAPPKSLTVGVISGYNEQKILLTEEIQPAAKVWVVCDIRIDNVDAFQGQEKDIVLYSIVRSNANRELGFLRDDRRLNVALSRARRLLIIVGDQVMVENARTGDRPNPFLRVSDFVKRHPGTCTVEVL